MKEFKDKVAVITGAAAGIGRAIAEQCVREGMKVVLAGINEENLSRAEAELKALGGTVISVQTDVAKLSNVEGLAKKTLDTFGAVHLLVNNAGVGGGESSWETSWNTWEWMIGVNLWGVIYGIKVFTPIMLAQNTEGSIVNTASMAGLTSGGVAAPYAVTKHAVVALSEHLFLSLEQIKSLVKVSVLCPGFVKTNMPNAERNRPANLQDEPIEISPQAKAYREIMKSEIEKAMSPQQAADITFKAIREERFYILTHPDWIPLVKLRTDNLIRGENPINPLETFLNILSGG